MKKSTKTELLKETGRFIYSLPLIIFGLVHFINTQSLISVVPSYFPFPIFWVYFAGTALIAAGTSILINKMSKLALILLSILLFVFIVTVNIPNTFTESTSQTSMPYLLSNIGLMGAALYMAATLKNV